MKIYLGRHGQTNLNKDELMQGQIDEPLNDTGREQARIVRSKMGDIHFDAVYASPLIRSQETATIMGDVSFDDLIIDERIIESAFGPFEGVPYTKMGFAMTGYWTIPEIFPAPKGVETIASMKARSVSFLKELEAKDYETVLVVCHGGIMRPMCGYLEDRRNGLRWRPKPKNCEVRIYESIGGKHKYIDSICLE